MAQIPRHVLYQGGDVLLLRAAARSLDSASGPWPDPADSEELRTWLVKAWEDPVLREAVACASPSLALRADRIAAGLGVPARQVRSAAVALARYQLRAAGTPDSVRAVRRRGRGEVRRLRAGAFRRGAPGGGPVRRGVAAVGHRALRGMRAARRPPERRVLVAGGAARREVGSARRSGPAGDPRLAGRAGRPGRESGPRPGSASWLTGCPRRSRAPGTRASGCWPSWSGSAS